MAAAAKTMREKLEIASPYNVFYNVIPEVPETRYQDNAISLTDLLCPSLGELKCSLQITAKLDIKWLMKQYEVRNLSSKPLTVLYGEEKPEMEEFIERNLPNVTQHCVSMDDFYGSHHAKMGIYVYEDNSLRFVLSSANLYQNHWDHFNHGFWVSPQCHRLPVDSSSDGESPTNFKSALLTYLESYKLPSVLANWIEYVKRADFSDVRVCLVTSFPGTHHGHTLGSHIQQVPHLLKEHCDLPVEEEFSWPIVVQSSCVGQYGDSPVEWLRSSFLRSLASHKESKDAYVSSVDLKFIYPSYKNVKRGVFGTEIGDGMRYLRKVHDNQKWVREYFHQWKSDDLHRTGVMPHSKTYCRLSPCGTKMAWFLLTSGNATRGAWGIAAHFQGGIKMRNYEIGVMFFPKFFNEDYFKVKACDDRVFPMLYDLPLVKYDEKDQPWTLLKAKQFKQKCSLRTRPYHK